MDNLQEQINELQEQVNELYKCRMIENVDNESKIENYFKSLLKDYHANIKVMDCRIFGINVKIELLNEDNKPYFGTDFNIIYESSFGSKTKLLKMDYGAVGVFDIENESEQIIRIKMMNIVLDHITEIKDLFESLKFSAEQKFNEVNIKLGKLIQENSRINIENEKQKIKDQIIKDAEFTNLDFNNSAEVSYAWKIKITKVTDKRVYVNIVEAKYDRQFDIDTRDFDDCIVFNYKSGYIETEKLINIILYKRSKCIDEFHGIKYESNSKTIKTNETIKTYFKNL